MTNIEELEKKYKELGDEIKKLKEKQEFNPHKDKLFLLSVEEYNLVEENIRKYCSYSSYNKNWRWLRSPHNRFGDCVHGVSYDGIIGFDYVYTAYRGAAPAFIEETHETVGTRKIKYDFPFIYVGNGIWVSEMHIFWGRFDKNSNDYEKSEIRQKILEWAEERK